MHLVRDLKCDLSNVEDIKFIFSKLDDVDFVINVAGTNLCEPIENIEIAEWDRLMDVNLKSFFVICKEAVSLMKQQKYAE